MRNPHYLVRGNGDFYFKQCPSLGHSMNTRWGAGEQGTSNHCPRDGQRMPKLMTTTWATHL